jgi:hypothetical protein
MNTAIFSARNGWPRNESWWRTGDRCIPAPRLQWSRPLLQRLRELRSRSNGFALELMTW